MSWVLALTVGPDSALAGPLDTTVAKRACPVAIDAAATRLNGRGSQPVSHVVSLESSLAQFEWKVSSPALPKPFVFGGKSYSSHKVEVALRPNQTARELLAELRNVEDPESLKMLGQGGFNGVFVDPQRTKVGLKVPNSQGLVLSGTRLNMVPALIVREEPVGEALRDYFKSRGIRVIVPKLSSDPKLAAYGIREVPIVENAETLGELLVRLEPELKSNPNSYPLLRQQLKELALAQRTGPAAVLQKPGAVASTAGYGEFELLDQALQSYMREVDPANVLSSPRIVFGADGMPEFETRTLTLPSGSKLPLRKLKTAYTPSAQDALTPQNILAEAHDGDYLLTIVDF